MYYCKIHLVKATQQPLNLGNPMQIIYRIHTPTKMRVMPTDLKPGLLDSLDLRYTLSRIH